MAEFKKSGYGGVGEQTNGRGHQLGGLKRSNLRHSRPSGRSGSSGNRQSAPRRLKERAGIGPAPSEATAETYEAHSAQQVWKFDPLPLVSNFEVVKIIRDDSLFVAKIIHMSYSDHRAFSKAGG